DDVVGTDAGVLGRRSAGDVLHERAVADRQVERALQIGVDLPQLHADVTARDPPARAELRQDARRAVDWHRKPDVAGARADRGVDADHLAARVDQRSAAVA